MEMFDKISDVAMAEHEGAVAFEYLIILIIMAVALFVGFRMLQDQLVAKSMDISEFIRNNGQNSLGTTAGYEIRIPDGPMPGVHYAS